MTKLADTLRARAVKGEDFDKLQKEAYVAAGLPASTVNTKVERVRRTTLPANQQMAMDLKPGEVSEVISDPNGGHYIYKMVSKETLSLESVSPDIRKTISSQRYRDSMQAFQGNSELNDAYFGPARTPGHAAASAGSTPAPGARPRSRLDGHGKTNDCHYRRFGKSWAATYSATFRLQGGGRGYRAPHALSG